MLKDAQLSLTASGMASCLPLCMPERKNEYILSPKGSFAGLTKAVCAASYTSVASSSLRVSMIIHSQIVTEKR